MEIILLRHGKPDIPSLERLSPARFNDWVERYNRAGLCSSSKPPSKVLALAEQAGAIACSTLPRSIESARAINPDLIRLTDAVFNEAELPRPDLKFPHLSPKVWAVTLRIMWILGYARNTESLADARQRATVASHQLIELAKSSSPVLYVGHGVFNRLIAESLISQNWQGPAKPGHDHWSYSRYLYS